MNTAVISRKQTSFRLRTDLLERLREKAAKANRTLNNYVESVLLDDAFDIPNEETADAIREAKSGKYAGRLCMDNFEAFRKSIEEE
jgi:predicted DNA-binding protein